MELFSEDLQSRIVGRTPISNRLGGRECGG